MNGQYLSAYWRIGRHITLYPPRGEQAGHVPQGGSPLLSTAPCNQLIFTPPLLLSETLGKESKKGGQECLRKGSTSALGCVGVEEGGGGSLNLEQRCVWENGLLEFLW